MRRCCLILAASCAAVGTVAAQQVGEVLYSRGALTARQPESGEIRFLGKGMGVARHDVLTTGHTGFAVLDMRDGAKITLRPDTEFAVEQFADFFFPDVNRRQNDVAGMLAPQLDNPLAKIGIGDFDPLLFEVGI